MSETTTPPAQSVAGKPHYHILDGLRGVAALMVICYHVFEAFATSPADQRFNHGYLAVDFFFILSGFVIGYAYDDRFTTRAAGSRRGLTVSAFFRRRLIRLHPMAVMGAVLGVVTFALQGCVRWDGTPVSPLFVGVALVAGLLFLPAPPGTNVDVRGNGEMFPLNGPAWSLFFEYVANVAYALALRRLSTRGLAVVVALSGAGLAAFALLNGSGSYNLGAGWSLTGLNFPGGLLRVTFSFTAGLLMVRVFKPCRVRGAFWLCSLAVIGLLAMPYACGTGNPVLNGLYDTLCVLVAFPAIVWLGASGRTTDRRTTGLCTFVGNISYPVYAIHYPFMYLFYAWVWSATPALTFAQAWPAAVAVSVGSVVLAHLLLKYYDAPVRRWLTNRYG